MGIIHVDQLNAIFHHDGFGNPTKINHPMATHNLLGYEPEHTSFTASSTSTIWIGGPTPDSPARYALFKQYGIMNKEVMIEDEKRVGGAAAAVEGGKSKWQKKSKASKFPRVNPLAVTVAGDSPSPTEGINPTGPISAQITMASDVPTAVPVLTRPMGIVVPVTGLGDENVYIEREDPEIEALFDEFHDSLYSAEENAPQGGTA